MPLVSRLTPRKKYSGTSPLGQLYSGAQNLGGGPQVGEVTHAGHPAYHVNVIKLKREIICTGGFPHLIGLRHLPGVPHLHVNRPLLPEKCSHNSCIYYLQPWWDTSVQESDTFLGVPKQGLTTNRVDLIVHYLS